MSNSGNQNQDSFSEKVIHTIQDTGKAISGAFSETFGLGGVSTTNENIDPNIRLDQKVSESIKDSFYNAQTKDPSNQADIPEENKKESGGEDWQKTTNTAKEVKDFTQEKINNAKGGLAQNVDDSWQTTKDKSQDLKDFSNNKWESSKQSATQMKETAKDKTNEAWDSTKQVASDAKDYVKETWDNAKNMTADKLQAGKDYVKDSALNAKDSVSQTYDKSKDYIKNSDTVGKMQENIEGAKESIENTYSQSKDYLIDKTSKINEKVSENGNKAKESAENAYQKSKDYVKGGIEEASQKISEKSQDLKKDNYDKEKYAEDKASEVKESLKQLHGSQDFQEGNEEKLKKPTLEQPIFYENVPSNINADVPEVINYKFDEQTGVLKENLNFKSEKENPKF